MKSRPVPLSVLNLALATAYFLAGALGLRLAVGHPSATTVWPPAGIAIAAALAFGPRVAPGIFLGAFLVNLTTPGTLLTAACIAFGNTLEAVLAEFLVRRSIGAGSRALARAQGTIAYILLGALGATLVSPSIGLTSLALFGFADWLNYGHIWLTWWMGDAASALVITPLLLAWREPLRIAWTLPRLLEVAVLGGFLFLTGQIVFGGWLPGPIKDYPLAYATLPLLIWAACRFQQQGAALAVFALAVLAIRGTVLGMGPWGRMPPGLSLIFLQGFIGTIAATSLVLASMVAERRRVEGSLRESEERFRHIAEAVPEILFTSLPDGRCDWFSPRFYEVTGMPPGSAEGSGWTAALHLDDVDRSRAQFGACLREGRPYKTEVRFRGADGEYRWFVVRAEPFRDAEGAILRWFGVCTNIDDQKRAGELERHLAAIVESSDDAIIGVSLDGRILSWNPGAERLYGWEGREVIGKPVSLLVPPELADDASAVFERLKRGERVKQVEAQRLRKDGSRVAVLLTYSPIRDEAGRIVGTSKIAHDISARLESERELRQSREQLRQSQVQLLLITDSLPALVSYVDRNERYVFGNRAYEEWFGRPRSELRGKSLSEVLGEEAYRSIRPYVDRALRGEKVEFEAEIPYQTGGRRWIRGSYIPHQGPDGSVYGFFALVIDLTDRKRGEEAIARWDHIFSHAGWAVAVENPANGLLEEVNPGFAVMHGYAVEELVGKPLADVLAPESRGIHALPDGVDREKQDVVYESIHLRKDGSRFPVLTHASAFRGPDGRVLYRAAVFQDITDLKRAEEEVRELNATLERRVEERTSELREALRELESFSYTIAHDLRAPLRAMTGMSQMLAEEYAAVLGAQGADYTGRIAAAAQRMDRLIRDLLDYGRLTREELPLEAVDVNALLLDLLEHMGPEIRERRARVGIEGSLPELLVHRVTFAQVLTNLISNAIKFVAPGVEPRLRIRAERRDGSVRLWFEDNGIGVDSRYHERIFGVFQRLHPETSYPGTGIGLAIVKKAIERMGGRVGVESEPGRGSRFWIDLTEVGRESSERTKVHRSLGGGRS